MALTRIQYGGDVASGVLNDNFDYLDGRITSVGSSITTLQSNISTLNTTLSNQINTVGNNSVKTSGNQTVGGVKTFSSSPILPTPSNGDNSTKGATTAFVNNTLGSNGLFVTTYTNGTSWYREWFSNASKTTRVWLEQGGQAVNYSAQDGRYTVINFLKSFSNTNYTVTIAGNWNGMSNDACWWVSAYSASTVTIASNIGNWKRFWYACGK